MTVPKLIDTFDDFVKHAKGIAPSLRDLYRTVGTFSAVEVAVEEVLGVGHSAIAFPDVASKLVRIAVSENESAYNVCALYRELGRMLPAHVALDVMTLPRARRRALRSALRLGGPSAAVALLDRSEGHGDA